MQYPDGVSTMAEFVEADATTGFAISTLVEMLGELFTAVMGWAGEVVTLIGNSPLLLFFICLPFVTIGIGIVKRLMHM